MLSSVLNSDRAIEVNLTIMRTFVKLRTELANSEELRQVLKDVLWTQDIHTDRIRQVFEKLDWIINPPLPDAPRRPIGFPARA